MREREMRQRVERFIQTRLRNMLMPATLGLGLALASCNSSGMSSQDDGGAVAKTDAVSADTQGLADGPTADTSAPTDAISSDTEAPADAQVAETSSTALDAEAADSARQDMGGMVLKYLAQFPDAGRDLPPASPVYIAPYYQDAGTPTRYMGPQPKYIGPQPLYMGPQPLYMATLPNEQS